MNKNDQGKTEKSKDTIEITIPINGLISGANKRSISSDNGMSNMNSNNNEDTSEKGRRSDYSDENNFSNIDTSKKGQMSNQSDLDNFSDDNSSKKRQMIIHITED